MPSFLFFDFRLFLVLFLLISFVSYSDFAFAQFQQGGVDHPGIWWVGEELKEGDFFSYRICHENYKDCTEFEMDFWFQGKQIVNDETKWVVKTIVYDGNKIISGEMYLGNQIPEPTGGSKELSSYINAFKSSITWFTAYATPDIGDLKGKGPKKFSQPSWGKIANIGGEQIVPTEIQNITVPEGKFETIQTTWKTGGKTSKVWILDNFPFPIKASTWKHESSGIPPQEYRFELLDYQNVDSNPIDDGNYLPINRPSECASDSFTKVTKNTNTFSMVVEVTYKPANPISGCDLEWFINFKRISYPAEFENNVHYDILVVDENTAPVRSLSEEEGREEFFSASGQVNRVSTVSESEGVAHYAILVHGVNPENTVADPEKFGWVIIDVPISKNDMSETTITIPPWIKQNSLWWCQDMISDSDFALGIGFMIKDDILIIPETATENLGNGVIPDWVKNNACWWYEGKIDDAQFASGIQFLVKEGIISI